MTISEIKAWIDAKLTNTFMNSVPYLAAMAHIGWAALILLSVEILLDGNHFARTATTVTIICFAAIKEFWYDAKYEIPKQTFEDNFSDFIGYLTGLALGWVILIVRSCIK